MTDVFISYVHEDERMVQFLVAILKINNIDVWLDKDKLVPGQRWKQAIKTAITNGTYFLSIHSKNREDKPRSFANDELADAIDEVRRRPISKPWLIPIKIDECEIEARPLGGGESLLDLQICDLTNWKNGITALLNALGIASPIVDLGKPLAKGLPSFLKVTSGYINYEFIEDAPPIWQGMENRIVTGWCQRDTDDTIIAYFEVHAPITMIEKFNRHLGYTGFHAICGDEYLSQDSNSKSSFSFQREYLAPRGTLIPDVASGSEVSVPFDLTFVSDFLASGHIEDLTFKGTFAASIEIKGLPVKRTQASSGRFEISFAPDF